jgi:hypothetical protein
MGKSTISMAIFNSYFDITRGYPVCRELFMEVRSIESIEHLKTIVFCLFKIQFHHIYVEYATNVLKRHFWDTISQRKKRMSTVSTAMRRWRHRSFHQMKPQDIQNH